MYAAQLAFTSPAVTPLAVHDDHHGEAVLVTSRHSGALDDGAVACHASFAWRAATHVLPRPGGGCLRYKSHRRTAVFAASAIARARLGDRITRCWDGALFEVVAAYREGGRLCCELVELDGRLH